MSSSKSLLSQSKSIIENESRQDEGYNDQNIEDMNPGTDRFDDQQDNSSRQENSQYSNDEEQENEHSEEYDEDQQSMHSGEEFEENYSDREEHEENEESHNNEVSDNNVRELNKIVQESSFDLDEDYDFLQPERKITYKLFRFVNNLRESYRLGEFWQDRIGNKTAMAYAKYLLKEKENETVLKSLYIIYIILPYQGERT